MRWAALSVLVALVALLALAGEAHAARKFFEVPLFMGCKQGAADKKMQKCAAKVSPSLLSCFCWHDFDRLNSKSKGGHYMAVGGGVGFGAEMIKKAKANGNDIAFYINDMHAHGSTNGLASANAFWKDACQKFQSCQKVPKFWIMNEILSERWPSASYQKWVVDMTKGLAAHKVKPIISVAPRWSSSPIGQSSFKQIGQHGYLALELYVSGQMLRGNRFSTAYLNNYYGRPLRTYQAMGIPKAKIFMYEHYANSDSSIPYGRQGVSDADWIRTIQLRNQVISKLNFGGVLAYAWWHNSMHQSAEQRDKYYSAHIKTRNAMP